MPELMTVLTAAERQALCEQLAPLLAHRVALYTAHESSSVPVETARALLDGILLHLGLAGTSADSAVRVRAVLSADAAELLAQGERETRRAVLHAYARWQQLVRAQRGKGQRAAHRLPRAQKERRLAPPFLLC